MEFIKAEETSTFVRYQARMNGITVSYDEWRNSMVNDSASSRLSFVNALRECDFDAFFFEMKPVTKSTKDAQFEFVLLDAGDGLNFEDAQPETFEDNLPVGGTETAYVFDNLGGDAVLVAPSRPADNNFSPFIHLAAFCRSADEQTVLETWRLAIEAYATELDNSSDDDTLWLFTDGRSVGWLHFRIQKTPKYIKHGPYKPGRKRTGKRRRIK